MYTHDCTDMDMYTCMYWHCCVYMYDLTRICTHCMQILELYIASFAVRYFKTYWYMYCNIFTDLSSYLIYFSFLFLCRKTLMRKIHLMLNMSDTTYSTFALLEVWKLCLSVWNGHRKVSAILYNVFNLEPEPKFRVLA